MKIKREWKLVKDFPNYRVSNFGEIEKLDIDSGVWVRIKGYVNSQSVKMIHMTSSLKDKRTSTLARIVAENFIPNENPEIYKYVGHIDGNKQNNRADNLYWRSNRFGYNAVSVIDLSSGIIYESIKQCSRALGIPATSIYNVLKNKVDEYKGHKLRVYSDDDHHLGHIRVGYLS